jgi:chloramphenicol-sensitive protein RarD
MTAQTHEIRAGLRYAVLAYTIWGLFPLYWKLLKQFPAAEILFHRVFWSWIFYCVIRSYREKTLSLGFTKKNLPLTLIAASLLSGNWLLYVWSVNAGRVVETSLGYFINPLVNALFGVLFLGETLKKPHRIALSFAAVGVGILTYEGGRLPWIALVLAVTFSLYGLIKKKAKFASLAGNQLESLLMILPIFAVAAVAGVRPHPITLQEGLLLIGTGIVTGLPLLWFSEAASRIPYYLLGFVQFMAPTLQFLCGVVVFGEPLSALKLLGFSFIWFGIACLIVGVLKSKNKA